MVSEAKYRRNNQRWAAPELDRLLRAVRLEDVTPPVERFYAIATALERSPRAVRGMWLELRDAALRGRPAPSPAVVDYVRANYPAAAVPSGEETLDRLVAAYREAERQAQSLLERIFALAARDAESLSGVKQTLFGVALSDGGTATTAAAQPDGRVDLGERPAA